MRSKKYGLVQLIGVDGGGNRKEKNLVAEQWLEVDVAATYHSYLELPHPKSKEA